MEWFRQLEREAREQRMGLWAEHSIGGKMAKSEKAPTSFQELVISSLAQTECAVKAVIEKGVITKHEFLQKVSDERATYQKMLNPTAQ
jgi:hypothetical protein